MAANERSLWRLRRRLWTRLRASVRERVGGSSAELRRYEAGYQQDLLSPGAPLGRADVLDLAAGAELVFCGDYHSYRPAQETCLELLVRIASSAASVCLMLEMALSKHQRHIDAFLRGSIEEVELLDRLDYTRTWSFPWPGYAALFRYARLNAIPIVALNGPGDGMQASLRERDEWSAARIAEAHRRLPRGTRLLVLVGDLHLAQSHLPSATVDALHEQGAALRTLRVFQDSDDLYTRLVERDLRVEAVRVADDAVCLFNGTPWERLDSYLSWLDGEPGVGDRDHETHDHAERIRELADYLATYLGVPRNDREIAIFTPHDLEAMTARTAASEAELRRAMANDVFVLSGADAIFVARVDLAHTAEAAMEVLLDRGLEPPVGAVAGFTLRARRRALSYLGSKLLVPLRRPALHDPLAGEMIGRFVSALLDDFSRGAESTLLPLAAEDDLRLDHRVSLALGRELGERLYRAHEEGDLSHGEIRAMVRARPAPEAALTDLQARTSPTPAASL